MKKLLLTVLLLALIVIAACYIFIPGKSTAAKVIRIAANHNAVFRSLTEPSSLKRLVKNDNASFSLGMAAFKYNNIPMKFQERMNDMVEVTVDQDGKLLKGLIKVIPVSTDSSLVEWRMPFSFSSNPFVRIKQYIHANTIKAKMGAFLDDLKGFTSKNENIYGLDINRTRLMDSLLITTKTISVTNPTPEAYYGMIKQLQAYAEAQNAMVTNYPMLNITVLNGNRYETQVALPINKRIPNSGAFIFKSMVPKNILTADVKGGLLEVNQAFDAITNYINDHNLVSPAIPFQSMVTDRFANKDSSKWMTKLYYPIF